MNNYNQVQENNSVKRKTGEIFRGKMTGGRRFDRRNPGGTDRFPATCDKCGKKCEVPFRPTSGKPIYCSDCFEGKGGRKNEDFNRRDFGGRRSERPSMHPATCDKCGKKCEVPFRPTAGKPIYCNECFENKGREKDRFGKSSGGEVYGKLKEQFNILNAKLDRILSSLKPTAVNEPPQEENSSPKIEEMKEIKPKKATKNLKLKKKKSNSKDKVETI